MTSIQQQWESFEKACGLASAHPTQRAEMRRAFFGGAFSALTELVDSRGRLDELAWRRLYDEGARFGLEQMARDRAKPGG